MRQPLKVGLTGGVGAGKSLAAAELAQLGAEVVSGDALGREVLEHSDDLLREIRTRFGAGVFQSDGAIDRRTLGEHVFADADAARWLTDRTFPGIHTLWTERVLRCKRDVIVLDAALIFEWAIERQFDLVMVVFAPEAVVRQRMLASGRLTPEEVARRLASQIAPEKKARRADVLVQNSGNAEELREAIRQVWNTKILVKLNY